MASSSAARVASHAGSWYEDDADALTAQFDAWIKQSGPLAVNPEQTRVRAIISPSVAALEQAASAIQWRRLEQTTETPSVRGRCDQRLGSLLGASSASSAALQSVDVAFAVRAIPSRVDRASCRSGVTDREAACSAERACIYAADAAASMRRAIIYT